MKKINQWLTGLLLAGALALTGCSSDSGGGGTVINGEALAPGGQVAMFENQTFLLATIDRLIPSASAVVTGLDPVGGATVELIRVDDTGTQVGDVLASTVTSIDGSYSLALPVGVDFSGDLVVRITGNGGLSMSAMVVEQSVDITPVSDFVLQKFIEDGTALADLAINEVVALQGRVEEFDLTATADLTSMFAQLEAQVGQFIENEIVAINSVAGNSAAAAGNYEILELDIGFHDSDGKDWGTFALDSYKETLAIADAGNGDLDITSAAVDVEAYTNFSNNGSIYHEIALNLPGYNETFPATIDSNGAIFASWPFEEDLQTVTIGGANDPEGDGPDFGWRWPPGSSLFIDTGNGNTKINTYVDAGIRYLTTDTNADGIKDAINPNAKDGDEGFVDLMFVVKHGSGMNDASINGDYGLVTMAVEVGSAGYGNIMSERALANLDGAGNLTIAANGLDDISVDRSPVSLNNVTLTPSTFVETNPIADTYSVGATGSFALAGSPEMAGQVSADGKLTVFVEVSSTDDGQPTPTILTALHKIGVLTKVAAGAPTLSGSYRVFPLLVSADNSGHSALVNFSADSSLTFNADGSATMFVEEVGLERDNDVAENQAIVSPGGTMNIAAGEITTDVNGQLSIAFSNATDNITLDGFVSSDGTMIVLRVHTEDAINPAVSQTLGMMVAVKQ